jgi:hypothetical protein
VIRTLYPPPGSDARLELQVKLPSLAVPEESVDNTCPFCHRKMETFYNRTISTVHRMYTFASATSVSPPLV